VKTYSSGEIAGMDKHFRANFINSISGFKSANLIGTVNEHGQSNLAIFSSVIHIGSNPPLVGLIMRPTTVERHTYDNIIAKRHYTINALPISMREDGHRTSAKYSRSESEFDRTNFTEEFSELDLPYVKESPISFTCEFRSDTLLEINQTRLIIGEVKEVRTNPTFLGSDGYFDLVEAGIGAISGMDAYHKVSKGSRFTYARPDEDITLVSP